MLLGDPVLALPGRAVDDRDAVRARPRLDPAGEPAREPHQVRVIQLIVGAVVPPPPPGPEPARVVPQAEVGLQHNPVHAVIAAGQQIAIPLGEVIGHPPTVRIAGISRQPDCPKGATPSGRSPGRSVATLTRTLTRLREPFWQRASLRCQRWRLRWWRSQSRGWRIFSPVDKVARSVRPMSAPTLCPAIGSGAGAGASTWKVTNH